MIVCHKETAAGLIILAALIVVTLALIGVGVLIARAVVNG